MGEWEMKQNTVNSCYRCGKPLSDPISVNLGIGPICRIKRKYDLSGEKSENLFSNRSNYDYEVLDSKKIIAITDMGTVEKSVTTDIENVINDFINRGFDVNQYNIIYRDSMKVWDGIKIKNGKFKSFYSINEIDFNKAILKIKV